MRELLFELAGFFEDGCLALDGTIASGFGVVEWGELGLQLVVPFSESASVLLESFSLLEELHYLERVV